MKKALIVATIGGFLSTYEMKDAKLLQDLGYEVHYASNLQNKIYDFEQDELEKNDIVLHQVNISKNPFRLISIVKNIIELRRIILDEQISLMHCHTPVGGVVGRIAGHFSKVNGKRPYVIYTAHGFHFYKKAPLLNWILFYPVEYLLSKWTDCLVTINKEDYANSQKMLCKKCVRIPGVGVDLQRFQPDLKKSSACFRVISVGELNKNKNHSTVIKAIAKLNDPKIRYEIYGNGPYKEELENLIDVYGLKEQVKLKGFNLQIEKEFQKADCCVFPSYREGLGMAALEAMACGVPVIVSDNRGTREFIIHGENGWMCRADDVDAFAEAIKYYRNHPYEVHVFGQAGLKTVQRFSIEETTKVMRTVYEEL